MVNKLTKLPRLSIVVPAYSAESFLKDSLKRKLKVLKSLKCQFELIVVLDGEDHASAEIVSQLNDSRIKLIHYKKNVGKGFAVVYGMSKATGDVIGYVDAGLDLYEGVISTMYWTFLETQADIVYGSKRNHKSIVKITPLRKIISDSYHKIVKMLLEVGVSDTQTGAKLYRKEVIEHVLPRVLVKRFAFEAEIFAVAKRLGYANFVETPISVKTDYKSTVKTRDIFQSLQDTVAIFYRLKIRKYYDQEDLSWNELMTHRTSNLDLLS